MKNYAQLSKEAARILADQINNKKHSSVLCLPTGSTPLGMYNEIKNMKIDFSRVTIFILDEYVGLDIKDKESYHYYLYHNLLKRINICKEKIYVINGKARNLKKECDAYERKIQKMGLDLIFLGIGLNGHIGFNEPGTSFSSRTRVVKLSDSTLKRNSKNFRKKKIPLRAVTVGIKTIMQAKRIVLLASGKDKADIISKFVNGEISRKIPASILRKHKHILVILDEDAASYL